MATCATPGIEVIVGHYDFITLFIACKVPKEEEAERQRLQANHIDQTCRSFIGDGRELFFPDIGEIVGVFLQDKGPVGEWVRGRVVECVNATKGMQYKILLVDQGRYVRVMRRHVVQLNEALKSKPAAAKKIGLYGVLPLATLNLNTRLILTDFFHRGPIYFKRRLKLESILFGDITVKQEADGQLLSLAGQLLAMKLVETVDNFELKAKKFYSAVEGMEKVEEASCFSPPIKSEMTSQTPSSPLQSALQEKEEMTEFVKDSLEQRDGNRYQSKDTGYSSDEVEDQYVIKGTSFVPVGLHLPQAKRKISKWKTEEVQPITTYLDDYIMLEKHKEKKEKRGKRPKDVTKAQNHELAENFVRERLIEKRPANEYLQSGKEDIKSICQEIFKPRNGSLFGVKSQETKHLSEEGERRVKVFDFNYKSKLGSSKKVTPESEGELEVKHSERVSTSEVHDESRAEIGESLELAHSSVNPCDISSIGSVSSVANDSKSPNFSFSSSENSMLTKRQRVSQKLKAGLAEKEFLKGYSGENFGEQSTVEKKPSESGENCVLNQNSSMNSCDISFANSSIGSVSSVANDSKSPNFSFSGSENSMLSKRQRVSQKLKAGLAAREFRSGENIGVHLDSEDNTDSSTVERAEDPNLASKRASIHTEHSDKSQKETFSPNSSVGGGYNCNSFQDKRKRIQEKLKKQKEAGLSSDSETSQREVSTSCSLSMCNDDSYISNSKPAKKPTLESLVTAENPSLESFISAPIEELGNEDYVDFVDSSETQTFLKGICSATGVLIQAKDNRVVRPALTLMDLCLDRSIIQSLMRRGMREMNRIQKFAYPTILARRNIAMISPPRSGKTCAYVVPIASNLLDYERYDKLPPGNGPRALVITPYWESGAVAAYEFKELSSANTVVHCYGGGAELELKVELLQGCDVLVTTPRCALRLLDCGVTNLTRLCHLVMDDADVLFNKFMPEMQKLMVAADGAAVERDARGVSAHLQVVLAARRWTPPVAELVTCMLACPTICIASQLEACVYAGIRPTAVIVQRDKKIEKLVDVLKEVEGRKRIVVMCRTKDDVKFVHSLLIDMGVKNVIAAHEDLSSVGLSEVPGFWIKDIDNGDKLWESSILPVMVRSDEVLEEVPITNADVLIHYNMSNSKKTFSLRFICLMENYCNVFKKDSPKQKPQVVILLDEKNDLEVPGVMEFMQRLGTVLPEPVRKTLDRIEKMKDEKRMSEPLCGDVKSFGQCWDVKTCPQRHLVTAELDSPRDVPRAGWVKMVVQHVHDACHFSARLLEHAETKDEWRRLPSDLSVLPVKLNNYFAKDTNKRLHGHPKVGDIVALETAVGVYQRAVVLKIVEHNKFNEPTRVSIRLIDNGRYDYASVSRMWRLPEDMAAPPPSVVDVYLCGLRPRDADVRWPPAPGAWVDQQLRDARRRSPGGYLMGKISLALQGSLWLEPVEYLEFLPNMDTTVFLLNLRKDLLRSDNATENPGHTVALRRLCERAGITLPAEEVPAVRKPRRPTPQWAWLPQDHAESVHIVVVQDPDAIFLRLNYFADCLQKLVKEIQKYASTQDKTCNCNMLDVGDVCLGQPSGSDEWNRALVRSKPSEDKVELFFVDYGDTNVVPWTQVKPISNKLITQLPFQVIECYLAGLKFVAPDYENNQWEDQVVDLIYNLSRNDSEEAIALTVKVCAVETKATYTNGKRYQVVLANCCVDPVVILNSELVLTEYVKLLDEDILMESLNPPEATNELNSDCEDEMPSTSSEIVPYKPDVSVALRNSDLDEALMVEKVEKFLKEFEEGNFDCSIFHGIENDADVSDNDADGSVVSLPRRSSSLPGTSSSSHLALPPPKTEDSLSVTSKSISSSQHSSTLSLCQETNKSEVGEKRFSANMESPLSCEPIASSSPQQSKTEEHNVSSSPASTPGTGKVQETSSGSKIMGFSSLVTGVANNIRELISPGFLSSRPASSSSPLNLVEKVSPFFNNVSPTFRQDSVCDDPNNELDNTVCEMNANCNPFVDPNMKDNLVSEHTLNPEVELGNKELESSLSENDRSLNSTVVLNQSYLDELKPVMETVEAKKSPCQKWVECVIPDSDVDLSIPDPELSMDSRMLERPDNNNSEVRTPLVEWHQDDDFVYLHIKLPTLEKYEFKTDITSVHFSTVYERIPYKVDIPELFGGHKEEKARCIAKACVFEIRLEKLLKGKKRNWPRLTKRDEKLHWLKLNAEKACEGLADSDDEDVKRLACSLPLWNDNPTESNSVASSDRSELANSELSL